MPRKTKRKKHEQHIEQAVDTAQRVIQGLAIVALVVILIVDALVPTATIEIWIKGGLVGVAIGLSPKQILELIGNIAKSLTGLKNER